QDSNEMRIFVESGGFYPFPKVKSEEFKIAGKWVRSEYAEDQYPLRMDFSESGRVVVDDTQCSWSISKSSPFNYRDELVVDCPGKEALTVGGAGDYIIVDFGFDFEKAKQHRWCEEDIQKAL